ncbi:MAG: MotA/TolQ/ExbB proton channel family protein [Prevotellaceae bacterium]|jgi:biopolymer transport protein ExbB|nr:MotA/TolQ/ExbB proton channel family protein [Prevotellaceae bacterium]
METKDQKQVKKTKKTGGVSAAWVILGCAVVAFAFFFIVCGAGSEGFFGSLLGTTNFDAKGHPINGNLFGTLYQGGFVIPIVMTLLLTVIALSVERAFALNKAKGKGNLLKFVEGVNEKINTDDLAGAREICGVQKGSVANILTAALLRYEDIDGQELSNDEKAELVGKEIESATTLELPAMEQNMAIIAAISTLGTLMGLFGTVLGMIRSFGAMGQEGSPDSTALAIGISEALLNTALGIGTGALAIISYTYFSGKIQNMTNAVDEISFAIGQTFTKRALKK